MMRTSAALILTLAFASGCTITTRNGGHASSPDPERHASDPDSNSSRPHKPAEPRVARPEKPDDVAQPKPEPTKPDAKPDPVKPKPADVTPDTKPKPVATKPDPKPPVEPKPTPKPEPVKPVEPTPVKGVEGFVFGPPKDLVRGHPDAYWIYQDAKGWHLRTTTQGHKVIKQFRVRITITEGKFTQVKASTNEGKDRIKAIGRTIEAVFDTSGVMDGLDFLANGARCLHFDLLFEGRPEASIIRLGAKMVTPPSAVFDICTP